MKRRNFVKDAVSGAAATAALYSAANIEGCKPFHGTGSTDTSGREALSGHVYNGPYSGEYLNRPAFPLGGIGAGMICIEGTGALSHFSLRNEPDIFNEPVSSPQSVSKAIRMWPGCSKARFHAGKYSAIPIPETAQAERHTDCQDSPVQSSRRASPSLRSS